MKILGVLGILAAFSGISLIDWQKLSTAENSGRCKAVYLSIAVTGILIGILEMYSLVPHFDVYIIQLYKNFFGPG